MKTLGLTLFFISMFTGCNPNTNISSKEECTELGYKYATESTINKFTGESELNIICLDNKN